MPRPTTKEALLAASDLAYDSLMALIDGLPPGAANATFTFEDRDRNVRDVLGHLHAWHVMMLGWYAEGLAGSKPAIPAPGHTWATLPVLNSEIWDDCQNRNLAATRAALDETHGRVWELAAGHTDAELFTKKLYPWTGSTSLGAYFVSSMPSHYEWASKKVKRHRSTLV